MSRPFYFDSSSSDSESEPSLPYPAPLPRPSFLTPTFSPTAFLSSLHNRHQTLEDLRQELRTRSQELSRELLDLVNDNYTDFLSLGDSLKGGDERVEEVRVGLLGFRAEVDGLREKVRDRAVAVKGLVEERRMVTGQRRMGMGLVEVAERLTGLEGGLGVGVGGKGAANAPGGIDFSESEDESDDEDEEANELVGGEATGVPVSKLRRKVHQFIYVKRLIDKIGPSHPFLVKQEDRVERIRQTLLLDMRNAVAQMKKRVGKGQGVENASSGKLLKVLELYREMEESAEAVRAVKG